MPETMAAFVLKEHLGPATFNPPLEAAGRQTRAGISPRARSAPGTDGLRLLRTRTFRPPHFFAPSAGNELITHPRFSSVAARVKHSKAWFQLRADSIAGQTTEHWLTVLAQADIPSMRCNLLPDVETDPHSAGGAACRRGDPSDRRRRKEHSPHGDF